MDTYLRFAEAVNRLDISEEDPKSGLTDIVGDVTEGAARGKGQGVLEAAGEKLGDLLTDKQPRRQKVNRVRSQRGDR
ncbi:MAG: hypothetical protein JF631_11790 [Mycobacterium sp.]|nr:hypothetical protein [Mycobacterium sp.]